MKKEQCIATVIIAFLLVAPIASAQEDTVRLSLFDRI